MNALSLFFKDGRLRPFVRVVLYVLAVISAVEMAGFLFFSLVFGPGYTFSRISLLVSEIFLSALVVVGVSFLFRRYVDQRSLASLGLAPRGAWRRLFALGLVFGALMQTFVYVEERVFGHLQVRGYGNPAGDAKLLVAAAVIFLVAALTEELSIRGYILQNLWEEWGFVPAALISSLLFVLLHFHNPHSQEQVWLASAGLVFFALWASLSVLWTKSLWLALGCHASWNFFEGPVFGFPVSGLQMPVPTVIQVTGGTPDWFSGGNFGPEAGMSSMIAMLAATVALWALHRRGIFAQAASG